MNEPTAIKPDVVVVLGASLKDASTLSPQTLQNLAKLEEEFYYVKTPVILSGGYFKENMKTEASLMFKSLEEKLNTFGPIYLENESSNSSENVQFSLEIIQKHRWKNIVIIDQPLHLFQLRLLFKHYVRLKHLNLKLTFISAEAVYGNNLKWWQYSHFAVYFVYQILSTCYYILKGKITLRDIIQVLFKEG